MRKSGGLWLGGLLLLTWVGVPSMELGAQETGAEEHAGEPPAVMAPGGSPWFPTTRLFRPPLAALGEPGLRGAALSTNLLERGVRGGYSTGSGAGLAGAGESGDPLILPSEGRDFQGLVSLGESFPLRRFGVGTDGVQVGIQVGVTARFRLATSANEYLASDWVVGLPVEWARGPLNGRILLYHRSAHLGDEIMELTGVERLGFSHEGISILLGSDSGRPIRIYGGGSHLLRSETTRTLRELGFDRADRWEVQGGVEWEHGIQRPGAPLALFLGLDLHAAERSDWETHGSLLAGVAFRVRERSGRVALRWFEGPSPHGEFFLTPESAVGIELRLSR
jgi:hypothetical protein